MEWKPCKMFLATFKVDSAIMEPIAWGMEPCKLFLATSKVDSAIMEPTACGMEPCKLLRGAQKLDSAIVEPPASALQAAFADLRSVMATMAAHIVLSAATMDLLGDDSNCCNSPAQSLRGERRSLCKQRLVAQDLDQNGYGCEFLCTILFESLHPKYGSYQSVIAENC